MHALLLENLVLQLVTSETCVTIYDAGCNIAIV